MTKSASQAFAWLRTHSNLVGQTPECIPVGSGHIHRSFKLIMDDDSYFVQAINHQVFSDVPRLMEQIQSVVRYLKDYYSGMDYESLTLCLNDKGNAWEEVDGVYYRVFDFKQNLSAVDQPDQAMLSSMATAFAHFVRGLESFPIENAFSPILHFHDLGYRYEQLKRAQENFPDRAFSVMEEIGLSDFLLKKLKPLIALLKSGKLPVRMTHNDTKLSNVLFDGQGNARCIVDLDTVMPGSVIYDVGDSLRSLCTPLAEDAPEFGQQSVEKSIMNTYLTAYQSAGKEWLTDEEIKWLPWSGAYMACIMGMRFLTDYIQGNTYFRIRREQHNLDRARNQLHLARLFLESLK